MVTEPDGGLRPGSRTRSCRGALAVLAAGLLGIGLPTTSNATVIGGGGATKQDCLAVFQTPVDLPPRRNQIRCVDGDAACDSDGVVNGECRFPVAVCANSTAISSCSLQGVRSIDIDHSADNGDPKFDTDFQALQSRIDGEIDPPAFAPDDCANPTNFVVKLKGPYPGNRCRSTLKKIRMTTRSEPIDGKFITDVDTLRLICLPAADSCIPSSLFAGTFDRVQKQIFNPSCAVSGCHDSQSQTAGLLLEVGASHTDLVGVTPTNAAAAGAGWKRVALLGPTSGDPDTSLLFHKLTGDLAPGFGQQMPFGRAPLPSFLIEIVRLWILAGAPETGWVPGTDS